ncbi:MAG: hypothetical protein QXK66_00120 [Sulfolobales archaeon]
MARAEIVRCSIIKYRKKDIVLYPLGRDKEKIKHLHGKEVYVLIVAEGITSPNTNLYKTRNSCVRLPDTFVALLNE